MVKWLRGLDELQPILEDVERDLCFSYRGYSHELANLAIKCGYVKVDRTWPILTEKGREQLYLCRHPYHHTNTD